jgi:uncharacterized protein YciI
MKPLTHARAAVLAGILAFTASLALNASPAAAQATPPASYDAALAARLGADDHGMRSYVMVLLKTGPKPMPAGPERDAMFRGHFANMTRLASEGKLVLAGPFDGVDGWRGLFIFAVKTIDEARQLAATDPVLMQGEMVAEYHRYYGSAALMQVSETHERLAKKRF